MAIGGAVIADMYPSGARDGPLAFYAVGTMIGPTVGPILGGIITGNLGWRWVFWIIAILSTIVTAVIITLMPETYAPVLLQRKVSI